MVIVVGIVSVADEGVAACSVAAVHHHTAVAEVGAEHIVPFVVSKIGFLCITGIGAYAEEIDHTGTSIDIVAAAFCGAIAHIGCHTAVAHQLGDGVDLLRGAGGGEGGGHMGVVVDGAVVVDREGSVGIMLVAVGAATVDGIAPVVDDLGHGCGYAAGEGVTVGAVGILGAEGVVVLALVPGGGQQGADAVGSGKRRTGSGKFASLQLPPFGGGFAVLGNILLLRRTYLRCEVVEEAGDLRGQLDCGSSLSVFQRSPFAPFGRVRFPVLQRSPFAPFGRVRFSVLQRSPFAPFGRVRFPVLTSPFSVQNGPGTRHTIAQHGVGDVISSDDDEGAGADVDDIHCRLAAIGHRMGVDNLRCVVGHLDLRGGEVLRHSDSHRRVDRLGHQRHTHQDHNDNG